MFPRRRVMIYCCQQGKKLGESRTSFWREHAPKITLNLQKIGLRQLIRLDSEDDLRSGCRNVNHLFFSFIEIDGGYSAWSMWSMCSATCGEGVKLRSRICNSPPPRKGGKNCASLGSNYETMTCNEAVCPIGTKHVKKSSISFTLVISFPFGIFPTRLSLILPTSTVTYQQNFRQVEHTPLARSSNLASNWRRFQYKFKTISKLL